VVCAAAQEAGEPAGQAVAAAVGQMVVVAAIVGARLMAVDVVGRLWAAVATAGAGLGQMVVAEVGQAEPAVGAAVVRQTLQQVEAAGVPPDRLHPRTHSRRCGPIRTLQMLGTAGRM